MQFQPLEKPTHANQFQIELKNVLLPKVMLAAYHENPNTVLLIFSVVTETFYGPVQMYIIPLVYSISKCSLYFTPHVHSKAPNRSNNFCVNNNNSPKNGSTEIKH